MTLRVLTEPCWEIVCDGCGEGDNDEYGGHFHHPSGDVAIESARELDWIVRDDGTALCAVCLDQIVDRSPERVAEAFARAACKRTTGGPDA